MSDELIVKPEDMHATGTTGSTAAAASLEATDEGATTDDMHATDEPLETKDMHATSEPFNPAAE